MSTVYQAFVETAGAAPDASFLCGPPRDDAARVDVTFGEAAAEVERCRRVYAAAGYGHGHRVAILLGSDPRFVFHFLALNALGAAVVPVNPDNRHNDLVYLLGHSEADLVVALGERVADLSAAAAEVERPPAVIDEARFGEELPPARVPAPLAEEPGPGTICSLLYTSGTTGEPKGCLLGNECHLTAGAWYRDMGGVLTMHEGADRFYNPTPFHHVNNLVVTLSCVILTRNCLILVDRFSPARWWADIVASRATIMHYVGIIPALLMNLELEEAERQHKVRFGFGAGIEPQLHRRFEERFGIPLVEIWGMTETPRVFGDNFEPRRIDTRAFGRPCNGYEAKIVGENGTEAPRGEAGELAVRTAGPDPRRGFFSGYLKNEAATEAAWRDGWFYTGDIAIQGEDDMLYFVDRKKNIIRRAGENISAAEVEAIIVTHPSVAQVAIIAVPDELRDEEVMACIVPLAGVERTETLAREIACWCLERTAYFKCPAWLVFLDTLPVTPSQRLQRTRIFPAGVDPRCEPGVLDLREMKKRG